MLKTIDEKAICKLIKKSSKIHGFVKDDDLIFCIDGAIVFKILADEVEIISKLIKVGKMTPSFEFTDDYDEKINSIMGNFFIQNFDEEIVASTGMRVQKGNLFGGDTINVLHHHDQKTLVFIKEKYANCVLGTLKAVNDGIIFAYSDEGEKEAVLFKVNIPDIDEFIYPLTYKGGERDAQ